ncbi:hypothetical protein HPP92_023491 [Vanilla planifolia]|uniref:Uncharacterized protein n=1 Tax=Vanilla planifolia TaxID=51239 RepID=A0A835PQY5_VANPL|nr:hypothetical protein HPP92_023491 [Vanilla planifolia]
MPISRKRRARKKVRWRRLTRYRQTEKVAEVIPWNLPVLARTLPESSGDQSAFGRKMAGDLAAFGTWCKRGQIENNGLAAAQRALDCPLCLSTGEFHVHQ